MGIKNETWCKNWRKGSETTKKSTATIIQNLLRLRTAPREIKHEGQWV